MLNCSASSGWFALLAAGRGRRFGGRVRDPRGAGAGRGSAAHQRQAVCRLPPPPRQLPGPGPVASGNCPISGAGTATTGQAPARLPPCGGGSRRAGAGARFADRRGVSSSGAAAGAGRAGAARLPPRINGRRGQAAAGSIGSARSRRRGRRRGRFQRSAGAQISPSGSAQSWAQHRLRRGAAATRRAYASSRACGSSGGRRAAGGAAWICRAWAI